MNRKCNFENEVNNRKLAAQKKSIFWESSSCENVCLAIIDTQERTPALKLHLTGVDFT